MSKDVPDRPPLSRAEVEALPDGTSVLVSWSGGNGPHEYTIRRDVYGVFAVTRWEYERGRIDTGRQLDGTHGFVGPRPPFTRVWRADTPTSGT